jgi:imidazolonepropionase-like amidohydrolase
MDDAFAQDLSPQTSAMDQTAHDAMLREFLQILARLAKAPPIEAIRAATTNAAELLAWPDRVGSVEAGEYVDLIAVEGDPLGDVTVLRNVKFCNEGWKSDPKRFPAN